MNKALFIFTLLTLVNFSIFCQDKKSITKITFTEIKRPIKTISPYISHLLSLKGDTLADAISRFYVESKKNHLPLIEIDPLDKDYKYLTLIYQDSTKNKEISFDVFGIYEDNRLGNRKLRRLKNTYLYYRSYKVPNELCFSYRFNIKDTITGITYKSTDEHNTSRIPLGVVKNHTYSVIDLNSEDNYWLNLNKKNKQQSKIDTIRYTNKVLQQRRDIYVYLPPMYNKNRAKAYPVIYLFDASIYLNRIELPNILDNMASEGKIEPIIAVMLDTYRKTRGIILPLNFDFKDELINNIVPLIRKKYNTSTKATQNIIGGMSYGGLAACFVSFYHPNIFGKVLSQSGSLWRGLKLKDIQANWIRQDWLIEKYLTDENKKIKLYLDWGLQENWVLGSNRRMIRALEKKQYDYKFIEFNGWHDWSNSRKTFPQGLLYLLGKCE